MICRRAERGRRPQTVSPLAVAPKTRGPLHGGPDARIGAAATKIARQRLIDLLIGGLGDTPQQRHCRHHLTRLTVAALGDVQRHPGLLHRLGERIGRPFDGGDRAPGKRVDAPSQRESGLRLTSLERAHTPSGAQCPLPSMPASRTPPDAAATRNRADRKSRRSS